MWVPQTLNPSINQYQAWARIAFAHLRSGMGNGQAYSKLLRMGMKNWISNFWDWEWEWKPDSQHLRMGNGISFPKKLGMQLGAIKSLFHI